MKNREIDKRRAALRSFFRRRPRQMNALAKKAQVAESTIRAFLTGRSNSLQMDTYDKLAQAAGVPVSVLLGDSKEKPGKAIDEEALKSVIARADNVLKEAGVHLTLMQSARLLADLRELANLHIDHGLTSTNPDFMYDFTDALARAIKRR